MAVQSSEGERSIDDKRCILYGEVREISCPPSLNSQAPCIYKCCQTDIHCIQTEVRPNITEFVILYQITFILLFIFQVCDEFKSITTIPLKKTFYQNIDKHTPKLTELFQKKGGAHGKKINMFALKLFIMIYIRINWTHYPTHKRLLR